MAGCHGYVTAVLLLAMAVTTRSWPIATGGGKLLVILLDGARWDFMQEAGVKLPGFTRMTARGVGAEKMISTFPTSSYPNYYSIMTGLYSEDHGMVGNNMYDSERNESFDIGTNPEQFHANWWDDGDPLWVTAARQGKKTVMFHWPGSEVEIRGFRPDYCALYSANLGLQDFRWALNDSLSAFSNGSADFAGVYYEAPDKAGHKYGPSSQEVNRVMVEIDQSLTAILELMDVTGLSKTVDIIIVSDHGMTSIAPSRVVNTTSVLRPDDYVMIKESAALMAVWPAPGKLDQVYQKLRTLDHVSVYRKQEIPTEWHFKRHKLVSPIYLVADVGWTIVTIEPRHCASHIVQPQSMLAHLRLSKRHGFNKRVEAEGLTVYSCKRGEHWEPLSPSFPNYVGMHGYSNDHADMGAIFFASGPSFKQGVTMPAFTNVELYQVMCHILGVQPALHDGRWQNVQAMMTTPPSSGARASLRVGIQHLLSVLGTSVAALLVLCNYF